MTDQPSLQAFRRHFVAGEIAYHGDAFAWDLVNWNMAVAPRLTRFLGWCRRPLPWSYHLVLLALFSAGVGFYVARGLWYWLWLPVLFVIAHAFAMSEKR